MSSIAKRMLSRHRGVLSYGEIKERAREIEVGGELLSAGNELPRGAEGFNIARRQILRAHKAAIIHESEYRILDRKELSDWRYLRDSAICHLGVLFTLGNSVSLANSTERVTPLGFKYASHLHRYDPSFDLQPNSDETHASGTILIPHRPGGNFYGSFSVDFTQGNPSFFGFFLEHLVDDRKGRDQNRYENESAINAKRDILRSFFGDSLPHGREAEWRAGNAVKKSKARA